MRPAHLRRGRGAHPSLETILADFKAGQLVYTEEYEDVHTFVELHLIRRVGDVGKSCTPPAAATTSAMWI